MSAQVWEQAQREVVVSVLPGVIEGVDVVWITVGMPHPFGHLELRIADGVASMRALFVRENLRRHGMGRKLMERACAVAHDHGCEAISWSVRRSNVEALEFYGKIGAMIFGGDNEDWWMGINLEGRYE